MSLIADSSASAKSSGTKTPIPIVSEIAHIIESKITTKSRIFHLLIDSSDNLLNFSKVSLIQPIWIILSNNSSKLKIEFIINIYFLFDHILVRNYIS